MTGQIWYWVGTPRHKWNARCLNCNRVSRFDVENPMMPHCGWCGNPLPPVPKQREG